MRFCLLSVFVLLFSVACATHNYRQRLPDFTINGTVVNVWYVKNKKFIQVSFNNWWGDEWGFPEIGEDYFGSLDPKVGDCVRLWVNENPSMPPIRTDRDLVPCY